MARGDFFAKSGTGQTSSTYGRRQTSLIIEDETQALSLDVPVDSTQGYATVYTWNAGQLMEYDASGYAAKNNAAADMIIGMHQADRNSTNDETTGADLVPILLGPQGLRFSTNQIESGATFSEGTAAYASANGNFTNTDGTGPIVARARGAADSDGFVDFTWALGQATS